jgi:hypothetical protein
MFKVWPNVSSFEILLSRMLSSLFHGYLDESGDDEKAIGKISSRTVGDCSMQAVRLPKVPSVNLNADQEAKAQAQADA